MKRICHILVLLLAAHFSLSGQNKVRLPAWSFQDDRTTIIGLGAGLTTSENSIHVKTIGLKFELIGHGTSMLSRPLPQEAPSVKPQENIYGINISPFGTLSLNEGIQGISINLFSSYVKNVNGILVEGIGFGCAESMNGIQLSVLLSMASWMNGIQIGILGNKIRQKASGLQFAGISNESAHLAGAQISAIVNKVLDKGSGLQVSLYNIGQEFRGLQIGLVNRAGYLRGLQIGLVNISGKRILPILNW
jgi:hypothetical protein